LVTVAWVALGGAAGSAARYLIAEGLNDRFHPWGTVLVNVVGSLALGLLIGRWGLDGWESHQVGISVGLLGGFTTFSTFSLDVVGLWESGQASTSILIVCLSVGLGLVAVVAGLALGRP
jgi:fluoride exporter